MHKINKRNAIKRKLYALDKKIKAFGRTLFLFVKCGVHSRAIILK